MAEQAVKPTALTDVGYCSAVIMNADVHDQVIANFPAITKTIRGHVMPVWIRLIRVDRLQCKVDVGYSTLLTFGDEER